MEPVRPDVGGWLGATLDALKNHGGQLIVPGLIGWLLTMLVTLPLSFGLAIVIVAAAIIADSGGGEPPVWLLGVALAGTFLLIGALVMLNGALLHGLHRWCLALLRGETPTFRTAVPSVPGAILGGFVPVIQSTAVMVAFPFFIFPAIWVGLALALTGVAYADRGQGFGDAISRSMALTQDRKVQLWLFQMALMFCVMIIAYVPVIGAMAMYPIIAMSYAVVYKSLEEAETAAA